MNRWTSFVICVAAGGLLVVCGLLIPAHLRAVDSRVLQAASKASHSAEPPPEFQRARETFTEAVVRTEYRQQLLEQLQKSPRHDVQALLRFRTRTNTVIFSPSDSAS